MLTEPDVPVHFVIHSLRLYLCAAKEMLSVNKLNRMSTVWVSVKWFDIELSWRAIHQMLNLLAAFFSWRKKLCDVLHTKWRAILWNSIVAAISNSILIWSGFLMDATFFLLYLFRKTLLRHFEHFFFFFERFRIIPSFFHLLNTQNDDGIRNEVSSSKWKKERQKNWIK